MKSSPSSAKAAWARCIARRDTKLDREVAIKILPDAFAARCRAPGALRARSQDARVAQPSRTSRRSTASRRQPARPRPRDGTGRGRRSVAAHRARRDPARRGAADREADRRGARSRARAGDHPSRSEAREHQGARRRHGEGAGLRPREGDGPAPPASSAEACRTSPTHHDARDDAGGDDPRHGGLHGAGAGARQEPSTSAPTSGRSASCCSRCSPGSARSTARTSPTRSAAVLTREPNWQRCRPRYAGAAARAGRARCLQKDPKQRLRDIGRCAPRARGRVRDGRAAGDASLAAAVAATLGRGARTAVGARQRRP